MLRHTARSINSIATIPLGFLNGWRFSSSSKRTQLESKSDKRPDASSAAGPMLIDAFIKRAEIRQGEVSDALSRNGWACIDNFMGADVCNAMRREADGLLKVIA